MKRLLRWTLTCSGVSIVLSTLVGLFVGSALYDDLFVKVGKAMAERLPAKFDPVVERGYDYENLAESWVAHPDTEDWADLTPPDSDLEDGQHQAEASVFYVYPSGYFGFRMNSPVKPSLWRDPLGVVGDLLADVTGGMVHASVFNGIAKVFTPRYRQMTGWAFMLPPDDQRRQNALDLALDDVEHAFDHFLKVNHERPFILAGHSQGSMLLCRMLKRRYSSKDSSEARKRELKDFVVAYLVAADLGDGDCGDVVKQCHEPLDQKCFVHYNVFMDDGDRSKFLLANEDKKLTCVNPLSFRADEELVLHTMNPGSRPIFRPLQIVEGLWNAIVRGREPSAKQTFAIINMMSPLEKGLFGARCHKGVVWMHHPGDVATGFWTTGVFPGRNLHGGESSIYYMSTRLNAQARLQEHFKLRAS